MSTGGRELCWNPGVWGFNAHTPPFPEKKNNNQEDEVVSQGQAQAFLGAVTHCVLSAAPGTGVQDLWDLSLMAEVS